MLCIDNPYTDIYFNLAAEEYLLKNYSADIFMLYQNQPSVVIGRYQDVNAEVNPDVAKNNHLQIARRISGGGAVFHDLGNFNLVFIKNTTNPNFSEYATLISTFLHQLDIPTLVDERQGIIINGLKISGSAQYIFKHRTMFHATLLYNTDLEMLRSALDVKFKPLPQENPGQKKFVKSIKSPVCNLMDYLEKPETTSAFGHHIFNYFLRKNPENIQYNFDSKDMEAIHELREKKYATNQWISPEHP